METIQIEWRSIVDFDPDYQVSNTGLMRSFKSGYEWRLMRPFIDERGYTRISVFKNGKKGPAQVHRLVALAFLTNPENRPYVNHKDCNPANNVLSNLEWVTAKENMEHASINGRLATGERHWRCKISDEQIAEIKIHLEQRIMTMPEIARMYRISASSVSNIYRGSRNSLKSARGQLGYTALKGRKKIKAPKRYPDEVISEVQRRLALGHNKLQIAFDVGMDESSVRRIRDGKRKPMGPIRAQASTDQSTQGA